MNLNQLMSEIQKHCPNATCDMDDDGQIVINTNKTVQEHHNEELVEMDSFVPATNKTTISLASNPNAKQVEFVKIGREDFLGYPKSFTKSSP